MNRRNSVRKCLRADDKDAPTRGSALRWLSCLELTCLAVVLGLVGAMIGPAMATGPRYSDRELIDGFNRTVFGREDDAPGADTRFVSKFVGPIDVSVVNAAASSDRSTEVRRFVRELDQLVPGLQLRLRRHAKETGIVVYLVDRDGYAGLASAVAHDSGKARFMRENRCSATMWTRTTGVLFRAAVLIVVDEGERHFQSCLAEELTQALGPANDSDRLTHSLYNDSNQVDQFGLFDWFLLAALYDSRILPGMSPAEANAHLPAIFQALRAKAPLRILPAF